MIARPEARAMPRPPDPCVPRPGHRSCPRMRRCVVCPADGALDVVYSAAVATMEVTVQSEIPFPASEVDLARLRVRMKPPERAPMGGKCSKLSANTIYREHPDGARLTSTRGYGAKLLVRSLVTGVLAIVFLFSAPYALAYQAVDVCAEYTNTGQRYAVEAIEASGSELNRRTQSYRYSSFSKYVVIFWGSGEASVIELDSPFALSSLGSDGTDQNGRRWRISKGTILC